MATSGHEGRDDESIRTEPVGRHGEALHVDLFAMTLDTPHAETATAAPIRPRPLMASSVSASVPGIAARYRRHPLLHLVLGEEALVDLDQTCFWSWVRSSWARMAAIRSASGSSSRMPART